MQHYRKDYNRRIQDKENKIPADEPVFLLRAQDKFAPACLQEWLRQASGHVPQELMTAVENQMKAMAKWPVKKIPDTSEKQMKGTDVNAKV